MFKKISLLTGIILALSINCYAISARSYALVEASTGRLIEGNNVDIKLPMASTTKIMTGLLACESGKLDMIITVPKQAVGTEGSSIYLIEGEKMSLRDLTYGLMLESGNDAANAIAYILEGSIPDFAKKMNERAAELGLKNTSFANPSGLDGENHYTTALDLARLGAYAMKNEEFAKITSTYKKRIPFKGIKDGRLLCNHNDLLSIYSGTIGIKTGFIKRSGRCLVSCAKRNDVTLVAATLNGGDDLGDHMTLLDFGFKALKQQNLFKSRPELYVKAVGGNKKTIKCVYNKDISAAISDDEISRINMQINMPKFAYAPVYKGQKLGEIIFKLDGMELARTNILADETTAVQKLNPIKKLWLSFCYMF